MRDLISFERAAYGRAPDRVALMTMLLRDVTTNQLVEDRSRPDAPANPLGMRQRLVNAITAVLADPLLEISAEEADPLIPLMNSMRQLFGTINPAGLDLILRLLGDVPISAPIGQLIKRVLLISLDSSMNWQPQTLSAVPPRVAQQMMTSLLSTKPVMSITGQHRRNRLLEHAPTMPPAEFPATPDHLVMMAAAWMLCSYGDIPAKHAIKRPLNDRFREVAAQLGLRDAPLPAERTPKQRPVMLFAAEIMHSNHVQYRYFGQYLRQLARHFELVLLTQEQEVDEHVRPLFDRVLTFKRSTSTDYLIEIGRLIAETAPDIIFYPSVGMRHWGPLFANLRLAPIQMTALGHSASTFCDTIDYYLLEEGYVSDPALFGETVITVPDDSLIFERSPHYVPVAPQIRETPSPLRIALPSNLLKLNPAFLSLIGRIAQAAERPLDFQLLANAGGQEYAPAHKMVGALLPGATIHPPVVYNRYLEIVSSCDLNLSPFPFGGLHSVIDSLRQGLPVVAMDCPEPHGRTDAMLLRRLGMPEWLIAKNEEEYVAAALRIIGDDGLRVELSRQALALDIDGVMFGDATTPLRSEVGDAVWWLYRNHEAARRDGRKLWSLADRRAFRD